jgi:predicted ATP-grasp superfamily ATP-dependent carboligase
MIFQSLKVLEFCEVKKIELELQPWCLDFQLSKARALKLRLLEINARLWLHFWLPTICGIDIVFASYRDALGERVESSNSCATDVKSLCFPINLRASVKMIRVGEFRLSDYT